jgi:hypothetical protein
MQVFGHFGKVWKKQKVHTRFGTKKIGGQSSIIFSWKFRVKFDDESHFWFSQNFAGKRFHISLPECYMWLSSSRLLSVICGYPHLKQLLRRHKKQFSDSFLELNNKMNDWNMFYMWYTYTPLTLFTLFAPFTLFDWDCAENHSKYAVKQTDFKCFFPIVIIGYLFPWKTFKTFDMVWVFAWIV